MKRKQSVLLANKKDNRAESLTESDGSESMSREREREEFGEQEHSNAGRDRWSS